MGKNTENTMELNRETAMRLWSKSFGKATKVKDFAGRTIAKGAYNDRNSDYGWNVDHILPQSKGGVTADHNLICCHILTNDEKANKFPCFKANGTAFEIIKVQRHFEIRRKKAETYHPIEVEDDIDFYDSAAGVRYFKRLKGMQNKTRFVGTVFVRLENVKNNAVIDFIEEMFAEENISFSGDNRPLLLSKCIQIKISNYNMPLKDDTNELLDKCVLLHTYLSYYFRELGYVNSYEIYYCENCFDDKSKMYETDIQRTNMTEMSYCGIGGAYRNSLFINDLVYENSEAVERVEKNSRSEYTEYNIIFTKLAKNLEKEANGK